MQGGFGVVGVVGAVTMLPDGGGVVVPIGGSQPRQLRGMLPGQGPCGVIGVGVTVVIGGMVGVVRVDTRTQIALFGPPGA